MHVFQKCMAQRFCVNTKFCVNTTFCVSCSAAFLIWKSDTEPKAILCQHNIWQFILTTMAVLLVLPQPQAQQLLRAAEILQQRGPDGHPRASPLARAQFSVAPVLLERALPCSLRRPRKLQAAAAALLPRGAGKNGAFAAETRPHAPSTQGGANALFFPAPLGRSAAAAACSLRGRRKLQGSALSSSTEATEN